MSKVFRLIVSGRPLTDSLRRVWSRTTGIAFFVLILCWYVNRNIFCIADKPNLICASSQGFQSKSEAILVSIPLLGIIVSADPQLFLIRLMRSIDYPIEHIVIVHGSTDPYMLAEINYISKVYENLTLICMGPWFSVSKGWNTLISTFTEVKWRIVVNNDIQVINFYLVYGMLC